MDHKHAPPLPVEQMLALSTLPAFRALSPQELARLVEPMRLREYGKDAALTSPGMPFRALQFIIRGRVRVRAHDGGVTVLEPRSVLGDIASLCRDAPAPRATAEEPTLVLELDGPDIEELFEDNFPILMRVLQTTAGDLLTICKVTGRLAFGSASAPHAHGENSSELRPVERILALRKTIDYAGAEIEILAQLAEAAVELSLEPGKKLWQSGEAAVHFVVIVSGSVVGHGPSGEHTLFGAGSMLGGLEALAGEPRWYAAEALDAVRALRIDMGAVLDLLEDNMAVGMNLLRVLSRGIGDLEERRRSRGSFRPRAESLP